MCSSDLVRGCLNSISGEERDGDGLKGSIGFNEHPAAPGPREALSGVMEGYQSDQ